MYNSNDQEILIEELGDFLAVIYSDDKPKIDNLLRKIEKRAYDTIDKKNKDYEKMKRLKIKNNGKKR